jgi:chemotaxis signal transduction protein
MIDNDPVPNTHQAETLQFNPLLITFLVRKIDNEIQVRCRGCREIFPLAACPSDHIKGMIELDGRLLPVIDVLRRFHAEATEIGPCSCIAVIEQTYESQPIHTGIMLEDINDVMQLAAGDVPLAPEMRTSVNLHFVIETCHRTTPETWLADVHRTTRDRQPSITTAAN